jgi:hypothetical protein
LIIALNRIASLCQLSLEPSDRSLEPSLDRSQDAAISARYERYSISGARCATSTASTMDVCIKRIGHVVVDDVRNSVNVDSARCNVCCDQHSELAALEAV